MKTYIYIYVYILSPLYSYICHTTCRSSITARL